MDRFMLVERRVGGNALPPIMLDSLTVPDARREADERITEAHLYVILYKMDKDGNIEQNYMRGPRV